VVHRRRLRSLGRRTTGGSFQRRANRSRATRTAAGAGSEGRGAGAARAASLGAASQGNARRPSRGVHPVFLPGPRVRRAPCERGRRDPPATTAMLRNRTRLASAAGRPRSSGVGHAGISTTSGGMGSDVPKRELEEGNPVPDRSAQLARRVQATPNPRPNVRRLRRSGMRSHLGKLARMSPLQAKVACRSRSSFSSARSTEPKVWGSNPYGRAKRK
jgi:hypothetical protein